MDFFAYIGIIWIAVMIAKFFIGRAEISQHIDMVREEADKRIRIVKLETLPDQNTILAYDDENHQFLAQATDEAELKKRIMERYPEKIFLLDEKVFTALKIDGLKTQ